MYTLTYTVNNQDSIQSFYSKEEAIEKAIDMILEEYIDVQGDIICDEEDHRFDDLLNDQSININWSVLKPRFVQELLTGCCKGVGGCTLYIIKKED
jgi:hypothetical protein